MKKFISLIPSLIGILICAGLGSLIADAIVDAFGWQGIQASFTILLLSMFLAFVFFVIGVVLLAFFRGSRTNK